MEKRKVLKRKSRKIEFIEEDRAKIWKEHMEKIMNKKNEWNHRVETDAKEPVEKVVCNKTVEAIQKMKSGKATRPSEVSVEMIVASGEIGIKVIMELCQRLLDEREMHDEWKTSVIVQVFEKKGDVINCGSYRGVKLLENAMRIVERLLQGRIRTSINLNKTRKETVDAIFIVRRMQEEYQKKNKQYTYFIDVEKAFDRVPRRIYQR